MGADRVLSGADPPPFNELVYESERVRVTRLIRAGGTVIRKQLLGRDAGVRLQHELAILERLRGSRGSHSWSTSPGTRTPDCAVPSPIHPRCGRPPVARSVMLDFTPARRHPVSSMADRGGMPPQWWTTAPMPTQTAARPAARASGGGLRRVSHDEVGRTPPADYADVEPRTPAGQWIRAGEVGIIRLFRI